MIGKQWILYDKITGAIIKGPNRGRAPIVKFLNVMKKSSKVPGKLLDQSWPQKYYDPEDIYIANIVWSIDQNSFLSAKDFCDERMKKEKVKAIRSARYQGRRKLAAERMAQKQ
jgi:hypothetical protein